MSGTDHMNRLLTPEEIFDALARNKALMGLVHRNLVILNPEINDD
jgi:hypothetical protein